MTKFWLSLATVVLLSLSAPLRAEDKPPEAAPATSGTAAPAAPAPAAAPAAAPAPTAPFMLEIAKINSGDTAWMLSSTALVLLMTIPGLALFYGGPGILTSAISIDCF
jgi:ammonium transporter, Amt family